MNNLIIKKFNLLLHLLKKANKYEVDQNIKRTNIFRIKRLSNAVNILSNIDYTLTINNINKLLNVSTIKSGQGISGQGISGQGISGQGIPGIGKGTIARIAEILNTDHLEEINYLQNFIDHNVITRNNTLKLIEELSTIIGIGEKIAIKIIKEHSIVSLSDFRSKIINNNIQVNDTIKLGLKYFDLYQQHIPRKEIDQIYDVIDNIISKLDAKYIFTICGSYRRKSLHSNDIDVLLIHTDILTITDLKGLLTEKKENTYLSNVITELRKYNVIIDDLTITNGTKYMGFCQLNSFYDQGQYPIRRIDIRMMSVQSFFPALLYFTGSYEFNRKMRHIAKKQGYKLNEYGLFNLKTNKIEQLLDEKMAFDILGMEYLEPCER